MGGGADGSRPVIGPRLGAARRRVVSWWFQRTIRTRLVAMTIVPLVVALCIGTVAVTVLFSAGRIRSVDRQTRAEAATLAGLAQSGQLPTPLPVPAGSPLLAQVIDDDGTVLAASASASLVLPLVTHPSMSTRANDDTDEDNPFVAAALRLRVQRVTVAGRAAVIVVAAPLADVQSALRSLETVILVIVPILTVLVGLLEWVIIGLTLRPVERLRIAAAGLALDTRTPSAPGTSTGAAARTPTLLLPMGTGDDEITRLAHTLNELLRRLERSMAQQRDLVADAAHELRSPLASMRVQLDVARAHPTPETAADLTADLAPEIDRLTRLVNDLLLLGRLEGGGSAKRTPVDLSELAGATGSSVVVRGDRDSLERLVRNLVDNAHEHGGSVRVSVHREGGMAVLEVDDDGPGIPVEDRERVFERWTRLDLARDRVSGGSGLGLTLVREIAVAHGGSAGITESPLGGTRVRVILPAAPGHPAPGHPASGHSATGPEDAAAGR